MKPIRVEQSIALGAAAGRLLKLRAKWQGSIVKPRLMPVFSKGRQVDLLLVWPNGTAQRCFRGCAFQVGGLAQ